MKYVFGMIVSVAAILIIVDTSMALKEEYFKDRTDLQSVFDSYIGSAGVSINGEGQVRAVDYMNAEILYQYNDEDYSTENTFVYFPERWFDSGKLSENFWAYSRVSYLTSGDEESRQCSGEYYSDFLVKDFRSGKVSKVFDRLVAILQFSRVSDEAAARDYLLIQLVENDSDGDNLLTCKDDVVTYIYSFNDQSISSVGANGTRLFFSGSEYGSYDVIWTVSLGVDENGDGKFDPTVERTQAALLDITTGKIEILKQE